MILVAFVCVVMARAHERADRDVIDEANRAGLDLGALKDARALARWHRARAEVWRSRAYRFGWPLG